MQITKFYNEEYVHSALYQSFRSIGNYIDGMKVSARKIFYVVDKNNIKNEIKVSSLSSMVINETEYLHGDVSLNGNVIGLAANYIGSNNINLLFPSGNFGSRFMGLDGAAAPRYIYTYKSRIFDYLFKKEDTPILINQIFEGNYIEYKYYIPILPMILVNGNEGIGNGFSQKIFPRDPKVIFSIMKSYLKNKKLPKEITPYFKGFIGSIFKTEKERQWAIHGKIEKINTYTIKITELPIGWKLNDYISQLNDLVENKIIKDYDDRSEDDKYEFIIKIDGEMGKKSEDELLTILKLKSTFTENFTCVDENNAIREFKSEIEILEAYIKIRLEYYKKRKEYQLQTLKDEMKVLNNKALFIDNIINNVIFINNKPKSEIEKQLETLKFDKVEDNYNYLLSMSIYSLTKEKYDELKKQIKNKEDEFNKLLNMKIEDIWLNELNELEKML